MKRLFGVLAGVAVALALIPATAAAGPAVANGGGRGTVDGEHAFSQFGFSVTRSADGSVRGSFNCLMAGASEFPGFTLMAVRRQVKHANAVEARGAPADGGARFKRFAGGDGRVGIPGRISRG